MRSVAEFVRSFDCLPPRGFRYLASGVNHDVFTITYQKTKYVLRVGYYSQSLVDRVTAHTRAGHAERASRLLLKTPVMVTNRLAEVTNRLRSDSRSPHFPLCFGYHYCTDFFEKVEKYVPRNTLPQRTAHTSVSVLEHWDESLTQLLARRNLGDDGLAAVVFQVTYTLALLQHVLPHFRHNDLSTNNVLVRRAAPKRQRGVFAYHKDGATFYVPATTVHVGLHDFEHAHATSLPNSLITSGALANSNITAAHNPSFDLHFFLATLYGELVRTSRLDRVPRTARLLADVLVFEPSFPSVPVYRLGKVHAPLVPATLLQHSYFDTLRQRAPGRVLRSFHFHAKNGADP